MNMNEPIINPWFFYLIGNVENLGFLVGSAGFLFIILSVLALIALVYTFSNECTDPDEKTSIRKIVRVNFYIAIPLWIFFVLIPSKEVCYQMVAAKYATPANLSKTVDVTMGVKNELKADILDIIMFVKDGVEKPQNNQK